MSENISVSIAAKDNNTIESFPPSHNTLDNIIENIKSAVFRSTMFTSKHVYKCELSQKFYEGDKLDGLRWNELKGAHQINSHHCYGRIQYHLDNEKYMKDANMYFECMQEMFQNHNWNNKEIKIQRSDGRIQDVTISENSIIRYNMGRLMFYVEFYENKENYNKLVPLTSYISEKDNSKIKGILELNPHLIKAELIIYIGEHPAWMNIEREELVELFEEQLKKVNYIYPEFNYSLRKE